MTNEQLAVLLKEQVTQLNGIIDALAEALSGLEVERETESFHQWIGEGNAPLLAFPYGNSNYRLIQTDTGDPVMLTPLKAFRDQLEDHINTLLGEREEE